MSKTTLIAIISGGIFGILVLLGGGGYYIWRLNQKSTTSLSGQSEQQADQSDESEAEEELLKDEQFGSSETVGDDQKQSESVEQKQERSCPANKKLYKNSLYGYSFCYPDNVKVWEIDPNKCSGEYGPCQPVKRKGDLVEITGFSKDNAYIEFHTLPLSENDCSIPNPSPDLQLKKNLVIEELTLWGEKVYIISYPNIYGNKEFGSMTKEFKIFTKDGVEYIATAPCTVKRDNYVL